MKIKILSIFIILFASLLAVRQLPFIAFFASHDDTLPLRQLSMHKCFLDGQIPCRWVPDMSGGYGCPWFNYYPPLPNLIAEPFIFMGLTINDSIKISFFLSLFLSGIAIYLLARKLFGNLAGLLAGIFYIWAPYRAVDIYIRGALNESWSFVFIPLIFLFSYNISVSKIKTLPPRNYLSSQNIFSFIFLALSWAGLLLSHNAIALLFIPIFMLWVILLLIQNKTLYNLIPIIFSSLWGLGFAAYFTLPLFFERKLIQLDVTTGYFAFRDHFVTIKQLFISRFWGDGLSYAGEGDGMAFQIGHLLWIFATIAFLFFLIRFISNTISKTKHKFGLTDQIGFIFICFSLITVYMTTDYSHPLWNFFPILVVIQFPWRFLVLVTFFFTLASAYLIYCLKNYPKFATVVVVLASSSLIYLNWNYFIPTKIINKSQLTYFNNTSWVDTSAYNMTEFLPVTSPNGPPGNPNGLLISPQSEFEYSVSNQKLGTNWFSFNITTPSNSPVIVNVLQFPNWKVFINGKEVKSSTDNSGRIIVDIPKGKHTVTSYLANTPVRSISNTISALSVIGLVLLVTVSKLKSKNDAQ